MEQKLNTYKLIMVILFVTGIFFLKKSQNIFADINSVNIQQIQQQYNEVKNNYQNTINLLSLLETNKKLQMKKRNLKNLILLNDKLDIEMAFVSSIVPTTIEKIFLKEIPNSNMDNNQALLLDNYIEPYLINNKYTSNIRLLKEQFKYSLKSDFNDTLAYPYTEDTVNFEYFITILEYIKNTTQKYICSINNIEYNSKENSLNVSLTLFGL
jgi:hypothetical protein